MAAPRPFAPGMAAAPKPFAPNSMDDYAKMSEQTAQQYERALAVTDTDIGGCYRVYTYTIFQI